MNLSAADGIVLYSISASWTCNWLMEKKNLYDQINMKLEYIHSIVLNTARY